MRGASYGSRVTAPLPPEAFRPCAGTGGTERALHFRKRAGSRAAIASWNQCVSALFDTASLLALVDVERRA